MNFNQLLAAPSFVADIPPPPYSLNQHTAGGVAVSLIFWAVSAAAFAGLWLLIRRRGKKRAAPEKSPGEE